jgi:hypothetical protein
MQDAARDEVTNTSNYEEWQAGDEWHVLRMRYKNVQDRQEFVARRNTKLPRG